MSVYDQLREGYSRLKYKIQVVDGSGKVIAVKKVPLNRNDYQAFEDKFNEVSDQLYSLMKLSERDLSKQKFHEITDIVNSYINLFRSRAVTNFIINNLSYSKGFLRFNVGEINKIFDTATFIPDFAREIFVKFSPIIKDIISEQAKSDSTKAANERIARTEKDKFKLQNKYDEIESNIKSLEERISDLKVNKPDGYIGFLDELKRQKSDAILSLNNITKKIEDIDKNLLRDMQAIEKSRRVTAAERNKKHKKMTAESNKLAQEIQRTIERVAAEGFGGGEYQYQGRGMKKSMKMVKPKSKKTKAKMSKGGRQYFEDPREEVAYLLKRIADLLEDGDVHNIGVIAQKLRKVKKIGKGKYYLDEDVYEGGKMKKEKAVKQKRVMSEKQKMWMDLIDKVQRKNPEMSRKECMKIASEKRNKSK